MCSRVNGMYKVKANVVFPIICKLILSVMSQYLHDYCLVENFGVLLKLWHLAEFTLANLSHYDICSKKSMIFTVRRLLITPSIYIYSFGRLIVPTQGDGILTLHLVHKHFCPHTSKYKGLPNVLVIDPMTLACWLWPDTWSCRSDAKTGNRLPNLPW